MAASPPAAADRRPSTPVSGRLSTAIAITRVICVFGIMYAHAWTGLAGDPLALMAGTGQEWLRWTLMEILGRGAVPLLSIISGWLLAGSTRTGDYRSFITGKARVILLPMLCWNALSILIVSGAGAAGLILAPTPHSLWWVVDELLCLATPNDINVQTAFLRDLFVCMLFAPLLLRAGNGWLVALAVLAAAWAIGGLNLFVLLRPQILVFFLIGIILRRARLAESITTVPLVWAILPAIIIVPLRIVLNVYADAIPLPAMTGMDLIVRVAVGMLFWRIAWGLAGSGLSARLVRLERYAFFAFCLHMILIWLGGPFIGRFTGPLGSPAYPVFLILQPVLVFAACIGIGRVLAHVAPETARILSGGRLVPDRNPPDVPGVPSPARP